MTRCILPHFHCRYGSREVLCAEIAELILASGTTELWQHPGDVGPGKSESPQASPARQEHKGGELLLICAFWAGQVSTSVA